MKWRLALSSGLQMVTHEQAAKPVRAGRSSPPQPNAGALTASFRCLCTIFKDGAESAAPRIDARNMRPSDRLAPRFRSGLSPDNPSICPAAFSRSSAPLACKPATLAGFPPHSPEFASRRAPTRTDSSTARSNQPAPMNTSMTLSSDTSDLVSLFVDEHSHAPIRHDYGSAPRSEAMSPSSTDSSLTNDDLVVLSDLFGFANSAVTTSATRPKRTTPARPRSRKRPRPVLVETGTVQPKSQQQRQKLEIEFLKKQVVELQSTIEELHARKLERERQALEQSQQFSPTNDGSDNSSSLNDWVGPAKSQVTAVQQLEEQNEKLRCQVAAHLGQLKQLEQIARTRYLANAIPEPMQLTDHSTSTYSASC